MKPNVKLTHIIGLSMDLGCLISINAYMNEVTVHYGADFKIAKLDDQLGMNNISDWLSLASRPVVVEAEAAKAVKQEVDAARFKRANV